MIRSDPENEPQNIYFITFDFFQVLFQEIYKEKDYNKFHKNKNILAYTLFLSSSLVALMGSRFFFHSKTQFILWFDLYFGCNLSSG